VAAGASGGQRLDLKELKEILQILEEQEITEFELEKEGIKLRIRKATSANHVAPATVLAPLVPAVLPAASPAPAPVAPSPTAPEAAAPNGNLVVKSPIVGTFYRTPDPNSPPFVSVGDHVRVGQVLCIIEAMKLMNEIESEAAGVILKIHHESGQPVQYGDALFTIQAD
jgi:acetyl-CoA carboxylase biotin carboxyl carrier protein